MSRLRTSHRCPRWCHKCPDLIEIVRENGGDETDPVEHTMPGCMGWVTNQDCCCVELPERRPTSSYPERLALLRELIVAYPAQARHLVGELAPPTEGPPRLRAVRR